MVVSPDPWDLVLAILTFLYVILGVTGVLLNGFCLFAMAKGKILKKNSIFLMVGVLTAGDFIFCVGFIIGGLTRIMAIYGITQPFTQLNCYLLNLCTTFCVPFTGIMVLLVALERLYLIVLPSSYHNHGETLVKAAIGINFGFSVLITAAGCIGPSTDTVVPVCTSPVAMHPIFYQVFALFGRILPCALTYLAYLGVVILHRRRTKRNIISLGAAKVDARGKAAEKAQAEIMKMSITICTVSLMFAIFQFLFTLVLPQRMSSPTAAASMAEIAGVLLAVAASVNVFIFPLKNADLREEMKNALGMLSCGMWQRAGGDEEDKLALPATSSVGIIGHERSPRIKREMVVEEL